MLIPIPVITAKTTTLLAVQTITILTITTAIIKIGIRIKRQKEERERAKEIFRHRQDEADRIWSKCSILCLFQSFNMNERNLEKIHKKARRFYTIFVGV